MAEEVDDSGVVLGRRADRWTPPSVRPAVLHGAGRPARWVGIAASVVIVATVLALLPGRTRIPPVIESDYCYLLTAADRTYEGYGPTTPAPVAPFQLWTWQADWVFLTQWPIGYPLLICVWRWLFGLSTIEACRWISVFGCAMALVGWFVWIRRSISGHTTGVVSTLLAAAAAGCSVSAASLVHPSTDLLLAAALPFVLIFAGQGIDGVLQPARLKAPDRTCGTDFLVGQKAGWKACPTQVVLEVLNHCARVGTIDPSRDRLPFTSRSDVKGEGADPNATASRYRIGWLILGGFAAGGLFWIRYASVFVPLGVGLFLLFEGFRGHPRRLRGAVAFAACAVVPIAALLWINHAYGAAPGIQSQLNLGHSRTVGFSPDLIRRAWWNFTALTFYDHLAFTHWVYALWPIGVIVAALTIRPMRLTARAFLAVPGVALSGGVLVMMLVMLIVVTAVFGDKFDYVGLDRYYIPGRPIYFLLFVAPVLLIPRRIVRAVVVVGLLLACLWLVQREWPRPYARWLAENQEATPYGERSLAFGPSACDLYQWLDEQADPALIVVSNFHEYIALETRIPALPIPEDTATLNTWIDRIRRARGIDRPRVLFVLDTGNRWRDYWIPPPAQIVETFGLTREPLAPSSIAALVFVHSAHG